MAIRRVVAVFAVVTAAALGGCGDEESAGPERGVTLEDVRDDNAVVDDDEGFEDPGRYEGDTVTVSGEVAVVVSDQLFRLGDEQLGQPQSVLVFAPGSTDELDDDDLVRVTGVVRSITVDTFEDSFGISWDPAYETWVGGHAIDASKVSVIDERG